MVAYNFPYLLLMRFVYVEFDDLLCNERFFLNSMVGFALILQGAIDSIDILDIDVALFIMRIF